MLVQCCPWKYIQKICHKITILEQNWRILPLSAENSPRLKIHVWNINSRYICVLICDELELIIGLQIWIMGDLKPTLAWNWLWFYPPKNVLRCFRVNAHLLWEEIWANSIFYWLRLDRALKVFFSSGDTVRKVHTVLNYSKAMYR